MASIYHRGTEPQISVMVGKARVTKTLSAVADAVQDLADAATQKKAQSQILTLCRAVCHAANVPVPGDFQQRQKFLEFAAAWAGRSKKDGNRDFKVSVAKDFAKFAGNPEMPDVTGQQVQDWLECLSEMGIAAGTIRNRFSVLSGVFKSAAAMGQLRVNPTDGAELSEGEGVFDRLPMPDEDLARLHDYLARSGHHDGTDWILASLLGRHAGLRLKDAVSLEGAAISQHGDFTVISCTPGKTGSAVQVPIFDQRAGGLLYSLRGLVKMCGALAGQSSAAISARFSALLDMAGVVVPVVTAENGRRHRQITFHSLRHRYVQSLQEMGVPQAERMALAGHATVKAHEVYESQSIESLIARLGKFITKP